VQIIMVGQPDLRDKLDRPELEQLRQRITVSNHLQPLDAEETARYINHRLARASIGAPLEFPRAVTDRIHERSGGIPRLINVIADATLVFGYGEERCEIDRALITEVITDLDTTGVLGPRPNQDRRASVVPADPAVAALGASDVRLQTDATHAATAAAAIALSETQARELAQREHKLRERETEIASREREVAEQRRVLAEQHRILRTAPPAPPAPAPPARIASTPVPAGRAATIAAKWPPRREPAAPRAHRYTVYRHEPRSFWRKVRDTLFGVEPALEDSL
jgi:hypothetical protein